MKRRPRNPTRREVDAAMNLYKPGDPPAEEQDMMTNKTATQDPPVQALATQDAAIATLPKAIEGAFTLEEWTAMSPADQKEALEILAFEAQETTRGVQVEFPRIKYPTSGASFWEIPTVEGTVTPLGAIEGVVVYKMPIRAYWPLGAEVGNPPTCSSLDSVVPVSGQGPTGAKTCQACPHAQWDSGKDGKGQACKLRLNVFLLMNNEEIPTVVSIPPSQLRTFGAFALGLRKANVPGGLLGVTTVLGLIDVRSSGGIGYKGIVPKIGCRLRFPEIKKARAIRTLFEVQMAKRGITVEEAAHEEPPPEHGQVLNVTATDLGPAGDAEAQTKAGF